MAAVVGRATGKPLLRVANPIINQQNNFGTKARFSYGAKAGLATMAVGAAGVVGLAMADLGSVKAMGVVVHPPHFPWNHHKPWESIDMFSVRRGYEVYKQVCAACHSLNHLYFRDMVGEIFSKERCKKEAAEFMVTDGPNNEGKMFQREGKLFDRVPPPYPNANAAAQANGGAAPPDLSFMTRAREGGEDYLFSLLTGYCDAPAGLNLPEGGNFNPYFVGGSIAMAQALYNEIIEYEDGTPATQSQLAKDITTFLKWTTEMEFNQRKEMGVKAMMLMGVITACTFYLYKFRWISSKTRKRVFLSGLEQAKNARRIEAKK